jgi:hypothetical protein
MSFTSVTSGVVLRRLNWLPREVNGPVVVSKGHNVGISLPARITLASEFWGRSEEEGEF